MGYTYYQKFDLAELLKGKTIAEVKYVDREGEHGFSFKFTDGTWLSPGIGADVEVIGEEKTQNGKEVK